ncbi:MAG: type III-A CRISPR-associated RAMP protein Csm5 [Desulfovermiculus sp.]
MTSTYTLYLTFLTPVFVGTGDELDPLSYVLKDKGQDRADLHLIDLYSWVRDDAKNQELQKAFSQRDMSSLRRFVAERIPLDKYTKDVVPVRSHTFRTLYSQVLNGNRDEHRLLLAGSHRSPASGNPFVPGSSLKGAIRTAVGNAHTGKAGRPAWNTKKKVPDYDWAGYNKRIFGQIQDDIFKFLKVGDVHLGSGKTQIVEPVEVSRNPDRTKSTPKNYAEVTQSMALGSSLTARARLKLEQPPKGFQSHGQVQPFDLPQLMKWLNQFYIDKYWQEMTNFYNKNHLSEVKTHLATVSQLVEELSPKSTDRALIRIGHYSHVESVTFDGLRDPKTKKGYGKTRTLAESLVPFGWVLLTAEPGYTPDMYMDDPASSEQAESFADEAQGPAPKPEASEQDQRQTRLANLKKELEAIKPANRPGIIPTKAKEVLADEDPEYVSQAAQVILEFVHGVGMKKKVKSKDWYKQLQSVGA